MQNFYTKIQKFAPVVLRVGIAVVFFYFGFSQLLEPSKWISFLPSWTSMLPISEIKFVLVNGLFEVIGAFLLLFGAYTRIIALLLALHLFGITFSLGLSPIAVRDFGLSIATLCICLFGAGRLSYDWYVEVER